MSIITITPAGALVNAMRTASEMDRREAARRISAATRAPAGRPRLPLAAVARHAFAQAVKAAGGLRAAAGLPSGPV